MRVGGLELWLHTFLILALGVDRWTPESVWTGFESRFVQLLR